jgi:hypothetical protein
MFYLTTGSICFKFNFLSMFCLNLIFHCGIYHEIGINISDVWNDLVIWHHVERGRIKYVNEMLIYNVLSWLNYIQSQMKFLTIQVVLTMKDYTNQICTYVNMETLKCFPLTFCYYFNQNEYSFACGMGSSKRNMKLFNWNCWIYFVII